MNNPLTNEFVKSSTMNLRAIAIVLFAIVTAFGGFLLASYAEADDAPGAVVIGLALVVGAVVLGVKAVLRRTA
jgi:hypothetical protein